MDLLDIYATRRARLLQLVDGPRFDGKRKALADKIGRSAAQVSQWLSGHRQIAEESRDLIEDSCGLRRGWLDQQSNVAHIQPPKGEPEHQCDATYALSTLATLLAQVPRDERQYLATQLSLWVLQGGPADMLPPILRMLEPEVQSTQGLSKQAK